MDNSTEKTTLYRYFDSQGQLLYVGITRDNSKRQSQHNRDSFWFGEVASAKFEWFESRTQAHAAEKKAIQSEKPLYNKQHVYKSGDSFDMSEALAKYHYLEISTGKDITGALVEPDNDHATLARRSRSWVLENREYGWTFDECLAWELYVLQMEVKVGRIKIPAWDTCGLCKKFISSSWYENELSSATVKLKRARKGVATCL